MWALNGTHLAESSGGEEISMCQTEEDGEVKFKVEWQVIEETLETIGVGSRKLEYGMIFVIGERK